MISEIIKMRDEIEMLRERVSRIEEEDISLVLVKEDFTHNKWRFEKGRRYPVNQDEHYVIITDDKGEDHYLAYDEAERYLKSN